MSPRSPELSAEELPQLLALWNDHPGMKHMGARVELTDEGEVLAEIEQIKTDLKPDLEQSELLNDLANYIQNHFK